MRRKAQAISINTIVVAAIALLVMVLIIMIFTSNIARWRQQTDACIQNGGDCEDVEQCQGEYDKVLGLYALSCNAGKEPGDFDKVCCVHS